MAADGSYPAMLTVLIAATARPALPHHLATLRAAGADSGADWDAFERLVDRHRVAALVHGRITDGALVPPQEVAARLKAAAVRDRRAALTLAALLVRLTKTLTAAGVPSLSLKGPVLAQLAYGDIAERHARDLDILVAPGDIDRAAAALHAAGCTLISPRDGARDTIARWWQRVMKDAEFVDGASGATVELHWRLNNNPHLMPVAGLTRRTVDIGGTVVETFSPDDLLLYLAVHGGKHFWTRLKWLADVWALTAPMTPERLGAFVQHAETRGLFVPAATMLLLLEKIFGLVVPPDLAACLERSRCSRVIFRMSERHLELPIEAGDMGRRLAVTRALRLLWLRPSATYLFREATILAIDLPTFQKLGGTGKALRKALIGRFLFWILRVIRKQ